MSISFPLHPLTNGWSTRPRPQKPLFCKLISSRVFAELAAENRNGKILRPRSSSVAAALAFSRLANSYLCPYALPRGLADVVGKLGELKLRRRQRFVP